MDTQVIDVYATHAELGKFIIDLLKTNSKEEILEMTHIHENAYHYYLNAYEEYNYEGYLRPVFTVPSHKVIDFDCVHKDYVGSDNVLIVMHDMSTMSLTFLDWIYALKAHRSWFATGGYQTRL